MNRLFETDPFEMIPLPVLARSFLGQTEDRIAIAGFQRNAVWKENKVEDLWDSIFCYFPIGSIMLARYEDFSSVGYREQQISRSNPYPDTLTSKDGVSFIVVDGQQRLNAISLGFIPYVQKNAARLWIDLTQPQKTGRRFDFYLCTNDNPFGINPDGSPFSREQTRQAFASIDRASEDDTELLLNQTYPYLSRVAVPFVELCSCIQQNKDANWENIRNVLCNSDAIGLKEKTFNIFLSRLSEKSISSDFINDVIQTIRGIIFQEGQENYEVPATLVKKRGAWMDAPKLGKLFERVNTGGVTPPQAELFFSALKLHYPPINNYIAEIYNDPQFAQLFRPTDLVLAVIRLIDPQIVQLELGRFENIVEANDDKLHELMEKTDQSSSIFKRCINLAYQTLHHNGQPGDIGLPQQYLSALRPRVWQTIAIWIYHHLEKIEAQGINTLDRLNMLRFAVFDAHNYFIGWQRGLSTYLNRPNLASQLSDQLEGAAIFPSLSIYNNLSNYLPEDYKTILTPPEDYRVWIQSDIIQPNWNQISNEHFLLMYAQRLWITRWESEKIRLDIDHIIPSRWMYFAGRKGARAYWQVQEVKYGDRYIVINASGNKRYWPDTLNRANQDIQPQKKFIHGVLEQPTDAMHVKFGLHTVSDILSASVLDPDLAERWASLSENIPDPRVWTTDRFSKFKHVVDERRFRLYKLLFDTLRFQDIIG